MGIEGTTKRSINCGPGTDVVGLPYVLWRRYCDRESFLQRVAKAAVKKDRPKRTTPQREPR